MISEHADRLVSVFSAETQVCGANWREPWDKKLVARKRLEDYISDLESQLAGRDALIERFIEAGGKVAHNSILTSKVNIDNLDQWDALVAEYRASKKESVE